MFLHCDSLVREWRTEADLAEDEGDRESDEVDSGMELEVRVVGIVDILGWKSDNSVILLYLILI